MYDRVDMQKLTAEQIKDIWIIPLFTNLNKDLIQGSNVFKIREVIQEITKTIQNLEFDETNKKLLMEEVTTQSDLLKSKFAKYSKEQRTSGDI